MGDIDHCFYPGCKNQPKLKCDCSPQIVLCALHSEQHIRENQTLEHNIKLRFTDMSSDWIRRLPLLKQNLLQAKILSYAQLLNKYNQKLQNIQSQFLNSTSVLSQKYDKIIKSIEILLDSIRIPTNWTPQSVQKLVNLDKMSIKRLSKYVEEKKNQYIFHIFNRDLYRINIYKKTWKKIPLTSLNENINKQSSTIDWNQNTIFQFGCANGSGCYKIEKKSGKCTKIPNFPGGMISLQSCVKFEDSIYIFGGFNRNFNRKGGKTNECYCFNVEKLEFTRIADLPIKSQFNSAVKVGKNIIVTGQQIKGVYIYTIESNSFSELVQIEQSQQYNPQISLSYQPQYYPPPGYREQNVYSRVQFPFGKRKNQIYEDEQDFIYQSSPMQTLKSKTLFKTSNGEIIYYDGYKAFKAQKENLGNWSQIVQKGVATWSVTDRREYMGKVCYLDHTNDLVEFDINTHKIELVKIKFN